MIATMPRSRYNSERNDERQIHRSSSSQGERALYINNLLQLVPKSAIYTEREIYTQRNLLCAYSKKEDTITENSVAVRTELIPVRVSSCPKSAQDIHYRYGTSTCSRSAPYDHENSIVVERFLVCFKVSYLPIL
jgi:hypothetical protein